MAALQTDELHLLSQVMSLYPSHWSSTSTRQLLLDVTLLGNQAKVDPSRSRRLKDCLLAPLARILLEEREAVKSARETSSMIEQQLRTSQEERNELSRKLEKEAELSMQQSKFIDTLLNDMDKMARVSEEHKREIRQLQHMLFVKEVQVQRLESDRQRAQEKALQLETFVDEDMQAWNPSTDESTTEVTASECESSVCSTLTTVVSSVVEPESLSYSDDLNKMEGDEKETNGLVQLVLMELWNEGVSSLEMIQVYGVVLFPLALVRFWMGLASRFTIHVTQFAFSTACVLCSKKA